MKEVNTKYTEIKLPESSDLEAFAEYGFLSYDAPKKVRHAAVSTKAFQEIEKLRKDSNETQGGFCGRILTEAVTKNYKPIKGNIQKNFRIRMDTERSIVAYMDEEDSIKMDNLAKSMGLKSGDYIRLVLYSALKVWNKKQQSD